MTLTRDEGGNCGRASARTLVVNQGRGSLVFNLQQNLQANGPIAADGTFRLVGPSLSGEVIAGKIEDGVATATFTSRICTYQLVLRKLG